MINKSLKQFCQSFDAVVEPSERRFARSEPLLHLPDHEDRNIYYKTETVNAIAIHIPEDRVDDFVSIINEKQFLEMEKEK